jgi:hypothetical protein
MENTLDNNLTAEKLEINENAVSQLKIARKWTYFLAITGFIFIGIIIIAFIVGIAAASRMGGPKIFPGLSLIPIILIGGIYFFPIYFLYQFSNFSKNAIEHKEADALSESLRYLKMHFKFMGILIIVVLSIYLVVILGMLVSGKLFHMF